MASATFRPNVELESFSCSPRLVKLVAITGRSNTVGVKRMTAHQFLSRETIVLGMAICLMA